ncbi:MAG: universal stress protein [Salinirussus sp.]
MYDTILLPTDGSPAAEDAADHAFSHADQYGATVHVLSVVEMSGSPAAGSRRDEEVESRREQRADETDDLVAAADDRGIDAVGVVEVGTPSRVITRYAAEHAVDLIVMSTHARSGIGRFLYGSVTERVLQDGDSPVLAIQR